MKKHLKVKAEYKGERCVVTILEQSHIRFAFGNTGTAGQSFVHGAVRIISYGTPSFRWEDHNPAYKGEHRQFRIWFPGAEAHPKVLNIPSEAWPALKEAIDAYNNHEF